jgi:hypothetical protein
MLPETYDQCAPAMEEAHVRVTWRPKETPMTNGATTDSTSCAVGPSKPILGFSRKARTVICTQLR